MISLVKKAEHFYGQWIFFKVDDMKWPFGTKLINCRSLYPNYLMIFFFVKCN